MVNARLGRRALVWAGVLAVVGVVLCFVPLFDVLGYDFAFALGLVTAFAAADVGHGAGVAPGRSGSLGGRLATAAAGALALLVVPLLASLLNALRVRNCNFSAGFTFFALLPVCTALFSAMAGVLASAWFPRRGRLVALLLPVGSVIWSLLRLYVDPPVVVFDPFGGYFPGPIYDEALRPPPRLLTFRLVNGIWIGCAALVTAAWQAWRSETSHRRRLSLSAAAAVLLVASIALFAARGTLGFHVSKARLIEVLRRETRSAHFVVHSDPISGHRPEDLARFMRDLEFRYAQLARTLKIEPSGPITVYLFPSSEVKKDLVGAGGTLYTKPWKREVFIQVDRIPARKLRHELAHIFGEAFGDPVFGVAIDWGLPPRIASGLIEGLAEAVDYGDPDGRGTIHQEARAMIAAGLAPSLRRVIGAGFTAESGARAYTLAGSFANFLLQTRGADRLRAIYRSGGDFPSVYGQPLEALESEWRAFLEKQPLEARETARAKERFRRGAIFQKVCARELAARVQAAREVLWAIPEEAVALMTSVCEDDPHEPSHKLDLADAHVAAGEGDKALQLATTLERDEQLTDPVRARAATLVANVHYHAGRFPEATAATERARALATDEGELRTAFVRLRALRDAHARATLGRMLFGDSPTRAVDPAVMIHLIERFMRESPDEALGPYLLGRQLAHRDPALALEPLEKACPLSGTPPRPVPLPPNFVRECQRLVGDAAYRAGNFDRSRAAWQTMRDQADTLADRLRAEDFLERLSWEKQRAD